MLAHQDAYLRGQRHRDRFACSSCLVMRRMRAKRRTFQLVQHGIKSPILLELPPPPHAGALGQGQLLNMFIVSFCGVEVNDNSAKMMQFPHFSLPFLMISRI